MSHSNYFSRFSGGEGAQVSHLWSRVYPAGQHEASCPYSHQHTGVSVSHVLQEFCPEADPQGPHDRPLGNQAVQMQGRSRFNTNPVLPAG